MLCCRKCPHAVLPCRQECVQDGSKYFLSLDSVAMVTNPDMIQHLLKIDEYVFYVLWCGS